MIERERSHSCLDLRLLELRLDFFDGLRNSLREGRDLCGSSARQLGLGGLAVLVLLRAPLLNAQDAVVDVILVVELGSDIGIDALRILDLAVYVVPLVAAIATYPVLAVSNRGLWVEVHLIAEVAEEVLVVGFAAGLAQVVSLSSTVVLRGLLLLTPVVLKIDGCEGLADFVSTLAVVLVVDQDQGIRDVDEALDTRLGFRGSFDMGVLRFDVGS